MVLYGGWHLRKDRLSRARNLGVKFSVASRAAQVDGHGEGLIAPIGNPRSRSDRVLNLRLVQDRSADARDHQFRTIFADNIRPAR